MQNGNETEKVNDNVNDKINEKVNDKNNNTVSEKTKENTKNNTKSKPIKKTKNKKNTKTNNLLNVAFVLTLLAAIIAMVYVYQAFFTDKGSSTKSMEGLNPKNETVATAIYNRIMSYDLDKVYPQSAEEVMRLYNDTVHMLYGDMIIDNDLKKQILEQQRKICSDELLNGMGLDEQFINMEASLSILKEQGTTCLGIEEKTIKYSPEDSRICTISVKSSFTNGLVVYRNYVLYKNDKKSRWEVYSWEQTDENYNAKIY